MFMLARFLPALVLVSMMLLQSCQELAPATRPVAQLNTELKEQQLVLRHEMPDENFWVVTEYHTDLDPKEWTITVPKNLLIKAWIEPKDFPLGESQILTPTVFVEHVHADIALESIYAAFQGRTTDTMDDSIHGGTQPGFWITPQYRYEENFAIEGYSERLWQIWSSTVNSIDLTEAYLRDRNYGGVTGNRVQVVYNLAIKYPGEDYFHTRSVVDQFVIPVGPLRYYGPTPDTTPEVQPQ